MRTLGELSEQYVTAVVEESIAVLDEVTENEMGSPPGDREDYILEVANDIVSNTSLDDVCSILDELRVRAKDLVAFESRGSISMTLATAVRDLLMPEVVRRTKKAQPSLVVRRVSPFV